jgi:hypothetical protein
VIVLPWSFRVLRGIFCFGMKIDTRAKAFRPLKRTGSSFLLVQERRNQKEGHPGLRALRASCAPGPRVTTGFFDGASLHRRKTARIVRAALRVHPPSPAASQGPQGDGHRARRSKTNVRCAQSCIESQAAGRKLCFCFCGHDARCFEGPLRSGERRRERPAGRCAGCTSFAVGTWMWRRRIPQAIADPEDRMSAGREHGVSFFLAPSFLDKQER